MHRALTATGPLGPDEVWERYAVPARWSTWSPQITRVDATSPRLVTGTTGLVHGPLGVRVPFEVLGVDEAARRWTWRVKAAFVTLHLVHAVLPHRTDGATDGARDGGTETTLDVTGPAPVVLAYAPLAQLALNRLVRP